MQYKTKGVVLISVLLIVLLLSSIAMLIGNNYFVAFKRAQYNEFQITALNVFRNIESLAQRKIDNELRFNTKVHSRNNPLFINDFFFELNQGSVTAKINDAANCFNINSLVQKSEKEFNPNDKSINVFLKLMSLNEVEPNLANEAVDQIIDWIDINPNPRTYGLEDYFYSGPLNNPKEYTASRMFHDIAEIKSLPAIRKIGWKLFKDNFCAMPHNLLKININSLTSDNFILLASLFENMQYSDAQYILDNIPEEGFKNIADFRQSFPSYELDDGVMHIDFSSSSFILSATFTYENFSAGSVSKIYYGANRNSYIISRTYNGI